MKRVVTDAAEEADQAKSCRALWAMVMTVEFYLFQFYSENNGKPMEDYEQRGGMVKLSFLKGQSDCCNGQRHCCSKGVSREAN